MPSPSSTPANTIRQPLTPNSKNALAGACAGILTSLITCPLDVVKTRFQAQINSLQVDRAGLGVPSGALYRGIAASLKRIWAEEGIRGLYRGLGPVMVGYLPTWFV
jgi:solute carrier family 25 (mitochondrial folate transporter), member 32